MGKRPPLVSNPNGAGILPLRPGLTQLGGTSTIANQPQVSSGPGLLSNPSSRMPLHQPNHQSWIDNRAISSYPNANNQPGGIGLTSPSQSAANQMSMMNQRNVAANPNNMMNAGGAGPANSNMGNLNFLFSKF
jgi:hypothetical protein